MAAATPTPLFECNLQRYGRLCEEYVAFWSRCDASKRTPYKYDQFCTPCAIQKRNDASELLNLYYSCAPLTPNVLVDAAVILLMMDKTSRPTQIHELHPFAVLQHFFITCCFTVRCGGTATTSDVFMTHFSHCSHFFKTRRQVKTTLKSVVSSMRGVQARCDGLCGGFKSTVQKITETQNRSRNVSFVGETGTSYTGTEEMMRLKRHNDARLELATRVTTPVTAAADGDGDEEADDADGEDDEDEDEVSSLSSDDDDDDDDDERVKDAAAAADDDDDDDDDIPKAHLYDVFTFIPRCPICQMLPISHAYERIVAWESHYARVSAIYRGANIITKVRETLRTHPYPIPGVRVKSIIKHKTAFGCKYNTRRFICFFGVFSNASSITDAVQINHIVKTFLSERSRLPCADLYLAIWLNHLLTAKGVNNDRVSNLVNKIVVGHRLIA